MGVVKATTSCFCMSRRALFAMSNLDVRAVSCSRQSSMYLTICCTSGVQDDTSIVRLSKLIVVVGVILSPRRSVV